jgi:hypothetical protein
MMGLDTLPTYKRVVAWFPGPVDDTGHYFQRLCRLNQGLDASHWRIYEHKEEPNGVCPWLSIDITSVMVLEDGMETIQGHGTGDLLPSGCETRREEVVRDRGKEEGGVGRG